MEFFKIRNDIPFMRYAFFFNIISILTFLAAIFFLFYKNLNFSIEFTSGTVMEVEYSEPVDLEEIRILIENLNYKDSRVQSFGTARDVLIKLPSKNNEEMGKISTQVFKALKDKDSSAKLLRVEFVGPQVGKELAEDGLIALGFVIIGIMIYLAIRFEWKFAVAAIFANLHDVIIILGFFAFFEWEFSLTVLAAVLAVLGYSVNESVVVFDRVRETFRDRRFNKFSTPEVINHAITRTISRTIITHGSTQLMVLSILIFGGAALKNFSLALTIGILFGIYSSIFVSSAIGMWLGVKREDLLRPIKEKDDNDGAVV